MNAPYTDIKPVGFAFSADGRFAAFGAVDYTVRVVRLPSAKVLADLEGHLGPVAAAAFSPDGSLLASGGSDRTVRVWDIGALRERSVLEGPGDAVRALAFGGGLLAASDDSGRVRLWDAATGKPRWTAKPHAGPSRALAVSAAGDWLASAGEDGDVAVLEASSGAGRCRHKGHGGPVTALAQAPDGRTLISASRDGMVRIWEPGTCRLLWSVAPGIGPIRSMGFSAGGRWLIASSEWTGSSGKLAFYAWPEMKLVRTLPMNIAGEYHGIGADPAAERLYLGLDSRAMDVCDWKSGKRKAVVPVVNGPLLRFPGRLDAELARNIPDFSSPGKVRADGVIIWSRFMVTFRKGVTVGQANAFLAEFGAVVLGGMPELSTAVLGLGDPGPGEGRDVWNRMERDPRVALAAPDALMGPF